ncbi:MAG: hypothetical protein J6S67_20370 [Methanobrevibacter sp.]|nr:hypothetical protein [Clostridia bacterium]MBO7734928.1 hypothetical protein [Methanobrevibacter sp.]
MDATEFKKAINELKSLNAQRKVKYYRNRSLYESTPRLNIENIKNPNVVGYYNNIDELNEDTTATPNLNVIKSCIDTLSSKIAQSKVRPFFNCVNGSFKDIQTVKSAQQFFDQYYDAQDVNKKVSEAFRDACIFEDGYIFVDVDSKDIHKALPWQVYERPAELSYGKVTRSYYERKDYPVTLLPKKVLDAIKDKIGQNEYVTYGLYFDTVNHVKIYYVSEYDFILEEPFEAERTPFIRLYYNCPVSGNTSNSVVDMLYTIQLEINTLMNKIKDASQLNIAMTYLIPKGSGLKTGQLNNRIGNIIEYEPTSNMTGSPVTVSTPSFIDPQYMALLNELIAKAYELVGISALSAQSKKPTGLNSGIALSTMEDVESERFETQLNQVIKSYVDIAKTCLEVFPQDEDILPEVTTRMTIKWRDIVEESKKMQIQFSSADSLSKDPSQKLQQLIALSQAGVIPQSRISQFMEIPDLQGGYSIANNAINAVMSIIQDCVNNDVFDIPEYIPLSLLEDEILNTQLSLRAANYEMNKASIAKLSQLYAMCIEKEKELAEQQNAEAMAEQIGEMAMQGTVDAGLNDATSEIVGGGEEQNVIPEQTETDLSATE